MYYGTFCIRRFLTPTRLLEHMQSPGRQVEAGASVLDRFRLGRMIMIYVLPISGFERFPAEYRNIVPT